MNVVNVVNPAIRLLELAGSSNESPGIDDYNNRILRNHDVNYLHLDVSVEAEAWPPPECTNDSSNIASSPSPTAEAMVRQGIAIPTCREFKPGDVLTRVWIEPRVPELSSQSSACWSSTRLKSPVALFMADILRSFARRADNRRLQMQIRQNVGVSQDHQKCGACEHNRFRIDGTILKDPAIQDKYLCNHHGHRHNFIGVEQNRTSGCISNMSDPKSWAASKTMNTEVQETEWIETQPVPENSAVSSSFQLECYDSGSTQNYADLLFVDRANIHLGKAFETTKLPPWVSPRYLDVPKDSRKRSSPFNSPTMLSIVLAILATASNANHVRTYLLDSRSASTSLLRVYLPQTDTCGHRKSFQRRSVEPTQAQVPMESMPNPHTGGAVSDSYSSPP